MISCLYDCFKHWSDSGSVYIMSDTHFDDDDRCFMDENWISSEKQIKILNDMVHKNDTLILLGDIGNPERLSKLKAGKKVLITGNHDAVSLYKNYFSEIYEGPLFVSPKILLSHEPIFGLPFCINIHGHNHNKDAVRYEDNSGMKHINLAANVCGYAPISLKAEIENGLISSVKSIHRITVDKANEKKTPV